MAHCRQILYGELVGNCPVPGYPAGLVLHGPAPTGPRRGPSGKSSSCKVGGLLLAVVLHGSIEVNCMSVEDSVASATAVKQASSAFMGCGLLRAM